MAKSEKTIIIERIFELLYDEQTGSFSRTIVMAEDLQEAKRFCNEHRGTSVPLDGNPYNFMKDIVRAKNAAELWPQRLRDLRISGEQFTGGGKIWEFKPLQDGEVDPLTEDFNPSPLTPRLEVQSLSLPLASKKLGRADEAWLLQVAVNLRLIETHFATGLNKQINAVELSHLQMDIKLRRVQIDALFLVQHTLEENGAVQDALITVEAKQGNQRILKEQIARQVHAAFEVSEGDLIIPTAIAAVRKEGIYVVEFKAVRREDLGAFKSPTFHRESLLVLNPPVKGI